MNALIEAWNKLAAAVEKATAALVDWWNTVVAPTVRRVYAWLQWTGKVKVVNNKDRRHLGRYKRRGAFVDWLEYVGAG
jgi:hypothetical protein